MKVVKRCFKNEIEFFKKKKKKRQIKPMLLLKSQKNLLHSDS